MARDLWKDIKGKKKRERNGRIINWPLLLHTLGWQREEDLCDLKNHLISERQRPASFYRATMRTARKRQRENQKFKQSKNKTKKSCKASKP